MANNLQAVADTLVMQAAIALRKQSVTPMLVARDLEGSAAQKNDVITVPVHPAQTVLSVTPGRGNENTPNDIIPRGVNVTLSNWKEVPFSLTDKEQMEVAEERLLPQTVNQAVIALANDVDSFCLGLMYKGAFAAHDYGAAFAIGDLPSLRKLMEDNNVPRDNDRHFMMNTTVESEALQLQAFHEADKMGDDGTALREASLGRKFGFSLWSNQSMPTHTQGDAASRLINSAAHAIGDRSVAVDGGSGTLNEGDLFTVAGDTQSYVIRTTLVGAGTMSYAPAAKVAWADNAAISYASAPFAATAEISALAWHRQAFVFATRPLATQTHPSVITSSVTDPMSGISLRMEVTRTNKQNYWSIDILYGGAVVQEEMLARMGT